MTQQPVTIHRAIPVEKAERAARALFAEQFGGEPAGVWAAPGRVNLIGEHTDYNGGLCLPIALPHRTYAAVSPRDDERVRVVTRLPGGDGGADGAGEDAAGAAGNDADAGQPQGEATPGPAARAFAGHSADESVDQAQVQRWEGTLDGIMPGGVTGWVAYALGPVWALREDGVEVPGLDIAIFSDVPLASGLSSSAAVECAVITAADELAGQPLTDQRRAELATLCVRAENEVALAPTGGLDQSASLRASEGHALLLDFRGDAAEPVRFDLAAEGLALLVIDTRASHALGDGQYGARRATCEAAARTLGVSTLRDIDPARLDEALARLDEEVKRRVRHVVTEIARVGEFVEAARAGDWARAGQLMHASHASLRDDYEVSVIELDTAAEAAERAGALGARMTGGGFGGSAIALVRANEVETVGRAVLDAAARAGIVTPHLYTVTPSAPAGRLD